MKNLESHIFSGLSRSLQSASAPMGAAALFALPEIQTRIPNVSRLSAYLDKLWRDGHLYRVLQHTPHFRSQTWAYTWRSPLDKSVQTISQGADKGLVAAKKKSGKAIKEPTVVIPVQQKSTGFDYLDQIKKGLQ